MTRRAFPVNTIRIEKLLQTANHERGFFFFFSRPSCEQRAIIARNLEKRPLISVFRLEQQHNIFASPHCIVTSKEHHSNNKPKENRNKRSTSKRKMADHDFDRIERSSKKPKMILHDESPVYRLDLQVLMQIYRTRGGNLSFLANSCVTDFEHDLLH